MSRLLLIRHAQASYGADDYDQLSPQGYDQASILGQAMVDRGLEINAVYVGPLKRQLQTLTKVREAYEQEGLAFPQHSVIKELEEHRGPAILKESMEAIVEENDDIRKWHEERLQDPTLHVKNGLLIFERAMLLWATGKFSHHQPVTYLDWAGFRSQVKSGFEMIYGRHKDEKAKTIALFTSGGTISAILGHVLGMQRDEDIINLNGIVLNASISEFIFSGDRITMKNFNDASHLPTNMKTYV